MASGVATVERLRQFLRELKPEARTLLIAELERSLLRGDTDEIPGAQLVLQELRAIIREQREPVPRIGNSARLFFKPLEPFLVDDTADHKHPGRLARAALEPLWTWIRRDLMADDATAFSDAVSEALLADDTAKAETLTFAFQDRVARAIEAALASARTDEKTLRRLIAQIGTPRAVDDAVALLTVLRARDQLKKLGAQLPDHIGYFEEGRLENAKARIDAAAANDPDVFLYGLLLVMSRLVSRWQLVRLATSAAESTEVARVAETPYAVSVTIVLAELERLVGELKSDLKSGGGEAVGALLKLIHDAARGLRSELDISTDDEWGRQLAGLRAQVSDLLKAEIESMPGRVRRLLRPRPSTEIRPNSALDPDEVKETESLIEFVGACRMFAGELALNEVTQRSYSELQQYLDSGTQALLDGLRHAGQGDRRFRLSQVEAAARFCGKVFGPDYAAMLYKAVEVASARERTAATA